MSEEVADTDHEVTGVGCETVVRCSETGRAYGPGTIDPTNPAYCPYCGDAVDDSDHRLARRFDEVFCENTIMSTWRYCPGCGDPTSLHEVVADAE